MADEPRFPPPEEAKPKSIAAIAPSAPSVASTPRVVVERAAPIEEAGDGRGDMTAPKPSGAPKMTPEEIRAFLAVEGAMRPTPLARAWRRGRLVMIPATIISVSGHHWIGGWADVVATVLVIGALLWSARPLFGRDAWS